MNSPTFARPEIPGNHVAPVALAEHSPMTGHAHVRATAVVHQTTAGVHTPVAVVAEPSARQTGARASVTAERVRARVLAQAVTVA